MRHGAVATRAARPASCTRTAARILALLVVAAGVLAWIPQAGAQSQPLSEYQVKAAFLYNFAKFVEWPADAFKDPRAPVMLGIVGEDPFGETLDAMVSGKTVNGRGVVVRRFQHGEDLRGCHILFISSSERKRRARILESVKGSAVLTVGEMDQFVQSGGAIGLLLEENKVRFEINVGAAARARLKISAKLLALAQSAVNRRGG